MDDFEVSVSIPLDNDGFLRRECPACEQQFKWHDGPANDEAETQQPTETYYCPLCGKPAGPDSWWTQEQLDYAQGVAAPAAMELMTREFDKALNGLKSDLIKVSRGHVETPDVPMPLVEPDDMVIVASPCHSYEPVKIPEESSGLVFCLVCGAKFAV